MQMGLHSMHAAALRPVMIAQPFVPRPQPRRATTAPRRCTSARATSDQTPQVSCRSGVFIACMWCGRTAPDLASGRANAHQRLQRVAVQDDQRLPTRRAFGAALVAGGALSFVNAAEAAGLRMKVAWEPYVYYVVRRCRTAKRCMVLL